MPFCASLRVGSCWRPHLEEPPCRAKKSPKERSPSLHELPGEFTSLHQVLQAKQSSQFVKQELCTLATTQWGTRGAVVPGELPRSFPNRTVGFKTSERFYCLASLKQVARHTHAGQPNRQLVGQSQLPSPPPAALPSPQ